MAVNTLGLAFTFLMTLAYNRAMGQALTMLFAMVNESSDVLLIIVFLAFAFGVASMPLLPSLVGTLNTTLVHSLAATNGTIFGNDNAWSSMNPNIVSDQVIYQKIPDNGIFMLPLWLGFYGAITLVDIGTYNDLQSDRKNSVTIAVLLLWVFAFFVSVFCMNLLIAKMASRYEEINRTSMSYRRFQHIALIKRYKDEGPAPPFNLLVLLVHTLFALMRQLPLTRRFAPAESTDTKHHHFTVFSGVVATAQSARIERSYQRDYVREDEARNIAARKETEVVQQAIASGISSLRQALSEELDKLEGRLDSGPFGRKGPTVSFESEAASHAASRCGSNLLSTRAASRESHGLSSVEGESGPRSRRQGSWL